MNSTADDVKNNKFLCFHKSLKRHANFFEKDSEELFERNLKTQSLNWHYRKNSVNYTFNSDSYRTIEFDTVDWTNSVILFGCSNVFGLGVDDDDTMASQLSKLIGRPVINMGVSGSSMTFSLHNAVILRDKYPLPLAVVNIWSSYIRTTYYCRDHIKNLGPWNADQNLYMKEWMMDDTHSAVHANIASKTSKLMWKNTKYFECSFFSETSKLLDCQHIKLIPDARDLVHAGVSTHYNAATIIAENLKL